MTHQDIKRDYPYRIEYIVTKRPNYIICGTFDTKLKTYEPPRFLQRCAKRIFGSPQIYAANHRDALEVYFMLLDRYNGTFNKNEITISELRALSSELII